MVYKTVLVVLSILFHTGSCQLRRVTVQTTGASHTVYFASKSVSGGSFTSQATLTADVAPGEYLFAAQVSTSYFNTGFSVAFLVDGMFFKSTDSPGWVTSGTAPAAGWNTAISFDDGAWLAAKYCWMAIGYGAGFTLDGNKHYANWIWNAPTCACYSCTIYLRFKLVIPSCPAAATCSGGAVTCPAGVGYRDNINSPCTPCAAGFFKSGQSNSGCLPCAQGTYQPNTGQTSCISLLCPGNATCSATGFQCNAGYFFNSTSSKCQACFPGTYKSFVGNGSCVPCPSGFYQPDVGKSVCMECISTGFKTNQTGMDTCPTSFRRITITVQSGTSFAAWFAGRTFSGSGSTSITIDVTPGSYVLGISSGTIYYSTGISVTVVVDGILFRSSNSPDWRSIASPEGGYNGATMNNQVNENSKISYWNTDSADFDTSLWSFARRCTSLSSTGVVYTLDGSNYVANWMWHSSSCNCYSCYTYLRLRLLIPECPPNAICSLTGSTCLPGYEVQLDVTNFCVACRVGFYKGITGRGPCQTCPANTYQDVPGSTSCKPCPQNAVCTSSSFLCAPGYRYFNNSCQPCQSSSEYKLDYGNPPACIPCPSGATCNGTSFICKSNYGIDVTGTLCIFCCAVSGYKPAPGNTPCLPCSTTTCGCPTSTITSTNSNSVPSSSNSVSYLSKSVSSPSNSVSSLSKSVSFPSNSVSSSKYSSFSSSAGSLLTLKSVKISSTVGLHSTQESVKSVTTSMSVVTGTVTSQMTRSDLESNIGLSLTTLDLNLNTTTLLDKNYLSHERNLSKLTAWWMGNSLFGALIVVCGITCIFITSFLIGYMWDSIFKKQTDPDTNTENMLIVYTQQSTQGRKSSDKSQLSVLSNWQHGIDTRVVSARLKSSQNSQPPMSRLQNSRISSLSQLNTTKAVYGSGSKLNTKSIHHNSHQNLGLKRPPSSHPSRSVLINPSLNLSSRGLTTRE